MQVSIEMWQVVVFVLTVVIGYGLFRVRKFLIPIMLISLLLFTMFFPLYVIGAKTYSRTNHGDLLGDDWRLRENVTFWEEITLQTVPYKVLKERQKVKDDEKKNYLAE